MTTYKIKTEERKESNDENKTIQISIPQVKPVDVVQETSVARLKEEISRMEDEKTKYNESVDERIAVKVAFINGIKTDLKLDITV